MGALAQYIEAEGVATTQVSLIREHTEAIRPPRALWVPFMLGRPFGVPNDAAFQTRVLIAALHLLEAHSGPVLEDYPEDAPPDDGGETAQVCPVSFASEAHTGLASALASEVRALHVWYDLAVERRGRTSVGLSGLTIDDAASRLAAFAERGEIDVLEGATRGQTLKLLIEDLRAFYYEAAAAKPGARADAVQDWFWFDTAAGRLLLKVNALCAGAEDTSVQRLAATSVVPRTVLRDPRAASPEA